MNKFFKVNEETGEVEPLVKYLKGQPKNYRFDGQQGCFKIGENPIIIKDKNDKPKQLSEFSLIPMAFRVFEENLFGRNKKEFWFELFFVDDKNAVSCIMFNNSSAKSLQNLQKELFYDDLSILDVRLIITTEDKSNEKGSWKMAKFDYEIISNEERKDLKELDEIIKTHNSDTLTDTAIYSIYEGVFFSEIVKAQKLLIA
jgi:hypothetical protein